MIRLLI